MCYPARICTPGFLFKKSWKNICIEYLYPLSLWNKNRNNAMTQKEIKIKVEQILRGVRGQLFLPYRQAVPEITPENYHICTKGMFKNLGMSIEQFNLIAAETHTSSSGSQYKILGARIYRCSDHWGRVASCDWDIDYVGENRYQVGVINLSDLSANDRPSGYVSANPLAQQLIDAAADQISELLPFASATTAQWIEAQIFDLKKV